uniref:Methyltransferase type 12 domain-containing protein n=1 Tax=Bionectria ochroleuca TaxID=29856 RepID=A0A8H7K8S9_BIOOC
MDYETINKRNWDERAPLHAASPDYNVQDLINTSSYISEVVQFDQTLLGDISNLSCVHLQCHIGTDTLSLARLGASSVTGLDFSGASLKEARTLAASTLGTGGEKLTFVEASVYDSLKILQPGTYDLVYTGIGALCWIPSVKQWAKVVSGLLKPGGRLFIREGHPMLWAVDEQKAGLSIEYPYFELEEPTIFDEEFTYVGTGGQKLKETKTASFNHGLGEIIQALLSEGLRVTGLIEHQSVPWNAVPGQMEEIGNGEFRLKDRPWRLPHSYTLQAMKE